MEGEKSGKWVYYRLAGNAPKAATEAIEWAKRHLVSEAAIKRDIKNLRAIIKQRPVEVCKRHPEPPERLKRKLSLQRLPQEPDDQATFQFRPDPTYCPQGCKRIAIRYEDKIIDLSVPCIEKSTTIFGHS